MVIYEKHGYLRKAWLFMTNMVIYEKHGYLQNHGYLQKALLFTKSWLCTKAWLFAKSMVRVTHLKSDGLQNRTQLLELQQEFLNNSYVFR